MLFFPRGLKKRRSEDVHARWRIANAIVRAAIRLRNTVLPMMSTTRNDLNQLVRTYDQSLAGLFARTRYPLSTVICWLPYLGIRLSAVRGNISGIYYSNKLTINLRARIITCSTGSSASSCNCLLNDIEWYAEMHGTASAILLLFESNRFRDHRLDASKQMYDMISCQSL